MSRTLALTQTLVILLSVLIFTVNPASADNHENNIIIDEIVEWANDQEVSGNIHITSQGELTISALITFTSVSLIEIDEGGKLNLINNAEIISDKRASSLKTLGFTDENNRSKITIPTSNYLEEMKIVIIAEEGALLNGSLVYVDDMDPLVMSGEVFSIDIPEGEQDTQLGFTGYGYFPIINSIILETTSGDVINEYKANDLPYQNMLLHGENGVTINSAGIIDISGDSIIKGLDISSSGEIKIKDSAIQDSCPIILTDDQASITMENTEISGSQDDYYVQLQPHSTINWGISEESNDVAIKGTLIDRWERIITGQSLIFDSIGVSYTVTGNSPEGALTLSNFSGNDGVSYINGGRARVIEIGWANGVITRENATIEIVEYRTAWNVEGSGIGNYGPASVPLTWDKEIDMTANKPVIEWVALTISGEEEIIPTGASHQISAVLANRGTESANLFFDCYITETGLGADIGGYQSVKIDPGEEVPLYFGWRNNAPGSFGLTCTILTPTQLVDYENSEAFGGGEISTSSITWEDIEEDSLNMLPIFIVILIIIISGGVYFVQNLSNDAEETAGILEEYKKEIGEDED
jgi:hypothetical protein